MKLLRTLRAFRVFRLFKRIKSLRKILASIVAAVPGVFNAFVVVVRNPLVRSCISAPRCARSPCTRHLMSP